MENRLNFTTEMREMIKSWKGKTVNSFIENNDKKYVTRVRFFIDDKVFDLENEYCSYEYPDKEVAELTQFNCLETNKDNVLQKSVEGEKCKETQVGEAIKNVYIVTDVEKGQIFNSGLPYELVYDTAIIIETEKSCYSFYRSLAFEYIEIALCEDLDKALKSIKSVEEILEESQFENPYPVIIKRTINEI